MKTKRCVKFKNKLLNRIVRLISIYANHMEASSHSFVQNWRSARRERNGIKNAVMLKLSGCLRVYAKRENKMEWKTWRRCEPNGRCSMRLPLLSPAMGHTPMTADTLIPRNRDSIEKLVPFSINILIAYARQSASIQNSEEQMRSEDYLIICLYVGLGFDHRK